MLKPVSYVLLIVGTTLMLQFQSCSSEMETELDDSFHLVYSGDVYIADSIETELGQDLIIKPGTTVTFGPDALLTLNGSLIAIGTPDSIIHFRGDDATLDQLILKARWETELLELQYVEINNGLDWVKLLERTLM